MASEKGIDIINARNEVNSVPTIKANEPNFPDTGSQVDEDKNSRPKAFIEGSAFKISVNNIALIRSKTTIPDKNSVKRKKISGKFLLEEIFGLVSGVSLTRPFDLLKEGVSIECYSPQDFLSPFHSCFRKWRIVERFCIYLTIMYHPRNHLQKFFGPFSAPIFVVLFLI